MAKQRKYARRAKQSGRYPIYFLLLLAVIAGTILLSRLFVLRDVVVNGNVKYSDDDITRIARVSFGKSIFSIQPDEIADRFKQIGPIELTEVKRVLPDRLELTVRERELSAVILYLGVSSIIDEHCVIVTQSSDLTSDELLVVTGVQQTTYQVGSRIESAVPGQIHALSEVLKVLSKHAILLELSELNVSNLDNMYLMALSGMRIDIGDSGSMAEKLNFALEVMHKLNEEGTVSGVIDVSSGKSAVYTPLDG